MNSLYDALTGNYALLSALMLGLLAAGFYSLARRDDRSPVRVRLMARRSRDRTRSRR